MAAKKTDNKKKSRGYTKIPNDLIEDPKVNDAEFRGRINIARYMNPKEGHTSHASVFRLAKDAGWGDSKTKATLKALTKSGDLESRRRFKKTSRRRISKALADEKYTKISNEIIDGNRQNLNDAEFRLVVLILRWMNPSKGNVAWARIDQIMDVTGWSRSKTNRTIASLTRRGLLLSEPRITEMGQRSSERAIIASWAPESKLSGSVNSRSSGDELQKKPPSTGTLPPEGSQRDRTKVSTGDPTSVPSDDPPGMPERDRMGMPQSDRHTITTSEQDRRDTTTYPAGSPLRGDPPGRRALRVHTDGPATNADDATGDNGVSDLAIPTIKAFSGDGEGVRYPGASQSTTNHAFGDEKNNTALAGKYPSEEPSTTGSVDTENPGSSPYECFTVQRADRIVGEDAERKMPQDSSGRVGDSHGGNDQMDRCLPSRGFEYDDNRRIIDDPPPDPDAEFEVFNTTDDSCANRRASSKESSNTELPAFSHQEEEHLINLLASLANQREQKLKVKKERKDRDE